MNAIASLLLWVGTGTGILIAGLITWHILIAITRLVLAWYLPQAIDLLLECLSAATLVREPWEPVLRGLRLCLPWPWPWRLERAARQLNAGMSPADLLRFGSLLPKALRDQAAQSLSLGPDAFATWCTSLRNGSGTSTMLVRQGAFLIAELAGVMAITYFITFFIFPKFEQILLELGVRKPALLLVMDWLRQYGVLLFLVVLLTVLVIASAVLARLWRRKRRIAAAHVLLAGVRARVPESALGNANTFAELCAANGWQADTPLALTREVNRFELRRQRRAAWLPAVFAALGPMLLAIPVGALVLGIMQVLLSILYQIESRL